MDNRQIGQLIVLDHYHQIVEAAFLYFEAALRREFPDILLEGAVDGERVIISLPPQREYTISHVDALATVLQEDLFWKKDVFIPYAIVREAEEE